MNADNEIQKVIYTRICKNESNILDLWLKLTNYFIKHNEIKLSKSYLVFHLRSPFLLFKRMFDTVIYLSCIDFRMGVEELSG